MSDEKVLLRVTGHAGRITLNRPQALNALDHEMSLSIEAALRVWAADDRVSLVVSDAVGEKAFCAGGDIAALYHEGCAGRFEVARRFWADEYRMNRLIAYYPKPYVALMDGIVMGGGVGLSGHGSQRVVTERSRVAMPECAIGLVPDVGGTLLRARAHPTIDRALRSEYRFTYRSQSQGDFLEGTRAAVIDRDRAPRWPVAGVEDLPDKALEEVLAPPGQNELRFD